MTPVEKIALGTLKVLAKGVKPGQELDDISIEHRAKRTWYSDHGTNSPNQVYVKGPASVMARFLEMVAPRDHWTGDDFSVWGFPNRTAADNFVTSVRVYPELSYWQVGLNGQLAMVVEYPRIGHFFAGATYNMSVSAMYVREERLRVLTHLLVEKDWASRIGISVVFVTDEVIERGELQLPQGSEIFKLDLTQEVPTKPGQQLKYVPADQIGRAHV